MRSRWHSSFPQASKRPPAMIMMSASTRQWSTLQQVYHCEIDGIKREGKAEGEFVSKSAREYGGRIMIRA